MRDKTVVPTNLLDWPRCANLLPDQRLILLWIWACQYLSCAGVGMLPLRAAAATLGLSPDALAGGLSDLQKLKLILMDHVTGELFILDWFRVHAFKSGVSQTTLNSAIKNIKSETIKKEVIAKSATCFPTATSTSTSTSTSTKTERQSAPSANPETLSVAAGICKTLDQLDVTGIKPDHDLLTTLLQSGASPEEFTGAAQIARERGKTNFAYVLGIVRSQRAEAKSIPEKFTVKNYGKEISPL